MWRDKDFTIQRLAHKRYNCGLQLPVGTIPPNSVHVIIPKVRKVHPPQAQLLEVQETEMEWEGCNPLSIPKHPRASSFLRGCKYFYYQPLKSGFLIPVGIYSQGTMDTAWKAQERLKASELQLDF